MVYIKIINKELTETALPHQPDLPIARLHHQCPHRRHRSLARKPPGVWLHPHQQLPPRHQSTVPEGYPPQAPTQPAPPSTDYRTCSHLTTEKLARKPTKDQIPSAARGPLRDPFPPAFPMLWDVCPPRAWGEWECP